MAVLTVRDLLARPKRAVPPARAKLKAQPAHREWNVAIENDDEIPGSLIVVVRLVADLPEQFSLGLRYNPPAGAPSMLLRVNGDHGPHRNPDGYRFLSGAHVHAPTEVEMGRPLSLLKWPEGPKTATLLEPTILRPDEGWRILAAHATIDRNDGVLRIIAKLGEGIGQGDLPF